MNCRTDSKKHCENCEHYGYCDIANRCDGDCHKCDDYDCENNTKYKEKTKMLKRTIIKRCGRYALISRENELTPYIVACGYDDKTGEWNQGYYFNLLSNAEKEFEELSGYACGQCPNVNDGCVICKRN